MRATTWIGVALLVFAACKKKEEPKAEPPPKVVDKAKPEPAPAPATIPVTSKSPEAIKEFEIGANMMINARGGEAIPHFKKAIELDPEFAQAHAYLGVMTPGAEGTDMLAKAGTLATNLPEAEKSWIAAAQAGRAGDRAKEIAAMEKTLELAPGAWIVDIQLAQILAGTRDTAAVLARLEHALSIKPDLPQAYNMMAYTRAAQREWDKAIAAAKKQVELLPKEPNPRDTLGEILLWSGKFEEAEKEFNEALKLEPKFTLAWQGIAMARAYRGDFKGAYEANDKRKPSPVQGERFEVETERAWLSLAEGKLPQALAALDVIEKDPEAKKLPIYAFVALTRGHVLQHAGKYADVPKAYATALTRSEALAGDAKQNLVAGHRMSTLRLAAMTGKPAPDTDKLVAAIEEDNKTRGPAGASAIAYVKGLAAWAKKDLKGAIAEMSKCDADMLICRYDLASAQRKSGDKAAAEATDKQLKETVQRDAGAVYLHSMAGKQ